MSVPPRPALRVEVATWRPLETVDVDGWEVGLSAGFTRRGNSVAPVGEPRDADAALAEVMDLYAARGLRPRVRVCRDGRPGDLAERLEAGGWEVAAPTAVLARSLDDARARDDAPAGPDLPWSITSAPAPDGEWLDAWLGVKASGVDRDVARRLVGGPGTAFLTARDANGVVGAIRAARAGSWVALSCLVVHPRARRRGLGSALTAEGLASGRDRGATAAFLQVEESNAAAVALYAEQGFTVVDRYHYREAPAVRPRATPARLGT